MDPLGLGGRWVLRMAPVTLLSFSIYSQVVYLTKVRWADREIFGHEPWSWLAYLLPPTLGAEPVRVAILDFSGITFVDAAGAREVVQVREWSSSGKAPSHPSCTLDLGLTPV